MTRNCRIIIMPAVLLAGLCFATLSATCAQEAGWGHLTGKLVVVGDVPDAEDLDIGTDDRAYCIDTGQEFKSRDLVVGPEGQLQDAFVMMYFSRRDRKRPEVHPSYDEKTGPVVLDNKNCRFHPRAIFVRTGQSIQFTNSDRIGHNCHVTTFGFEENCSLGAGQSLEVEMEEGSKLPGKVTCDAHPWMEALLLIRDEPYAAITDKDGNFRIENIPAGEWSFQFWHKNRGYMRQVQQDGKPFVSENGVIKVTIPDGGTLDLGELTVSAESLLEK